MKNGNSRDVCDGSFDPGYGTAAWCINGDGNIIRGVNIVPIGSDNIDDTRCELVGMYTILRIVDCMVQYYNINDASIEVGSDYESGLNRTLLSKDQILLYYTNDSHLDLINAINNFRRKSIVKITGRHILADQDKYCIYENLVWWSQRNIDMDFLAKSLMYQRRKHKSKTKICRLVGLNEH